MPPLVAAGWGIGEGDVVGDVMRGLPAGVGREEFCDCGALLSPADETPSLSEPKLMFGRAEGVTGPPLGR